MNLRLIQSLALVILLLVMGEGRSQETDPGLFADVQTTYGTFTIKLDYEKVPRTVANFAGLAEGSQAWVDYESGEVRYEPFYSGIVFHRVVEGFVIQAGSPAGDGTDGPGYTFRDEFETSLRHDRSYIVSMANSGPHSNGSQFFVTLTETPFLDDKHTVFGRIEIGKEVVDDIGQVTVDTSDRPIDPIAIESVVIRREGAAAQSFNVADQGLPKPRTGKPVMNLREDRLLLTLPLTNNRAFDLFRTEDLQHWSRERLPIVEYNRPMDLTSELTEVSQRFYRIARVDYPEAVLTSPTLAEQTLVLDITSHGWMFVLRINENNQGDFDFDVVEAAPSTGAIAKVDWVQEAYRGVVTVQFAPETSIVPLRCSLVFDSPNHGTFKGSALHSVQPFEISGNFTVEPAASP